MDTNNGDQYPCFISMVAAPFVCVFIFGMLVAVYHLGRCLCHPPANNNQQLAELQHDVDAKDREIAIQRHDIEEKDREIVNVNQKNDELQSQVNNLSNRLAQEMSKKVSADETSVENVAIKNRPMNIVDDYLLLCANEWLDAKTVIDELVTGPIDDATKVTLLCNILMVVEEEAKSVYNDIYNTIISPFNRLVVMPEETSSLPVEVTNSVGDYLRNNSHIVDTGPFQKNIRDKLDEIYKVTSTNNIWKLTKNEKEMSVYIQKATAVVWNMVIQRPPMTFQAPTDWKGSDNMDLAWGSDVELHKITATLDVTISPVHPMLFHGTKLMAKGKCLAKKKIASKLLPAQLGDAVNVCEHTLVDMGGINDGSHDRTPLISHTNY